MSEPPNREITLAIRIDTARQHPWASVVCGPANNLSTMPYSSKNSRSTQRLTIRALLLSVMRGLGCSRGPERIL